MSIFSNPFFSVAGQVERIKNVGATLSSALNPFSKDKIIATVSNPVLKSGLEFVANNPYSTALVAATAGTTGARTAVVKAVSKLSPITKIVTGSVGLATVGVVAGNPATLNPIIKGASGLTPESILKFGTATGKATKQPSINNITAIAKENPVITGALALGAGIIAAKTLPSIINYQNTKEVIKNTEATLKNTQAGSDFTAPPAETNKKDVDIAEENRKALQEQAKTEKEIAEINAKAALDLAKEQTKQLEIATKATPAITPAIVPTTAKKTVKKKKAKKKTKKKAKKKRKVYKSKKKRK